MFNSFTVNMIKVLLSKPKKMSSLKNLNSFAINQIIL